MKLAEAKECVGRKVLYTPFLGCDMDMVESGVITYVNDRFVFVRYGSDQQSKATRPEDLELEVE